MKLIILLSSYALAVSAITAGIEHFYYGRRYE